MRVLAALLVACAAAGLVRRGPPSFHTVLQQDPWMGALDDSPSSVSADGRHVAFTSYARLAPADTNDRRDIYVLDRADGHVTLESVTASGSAALTDSDHPRMSADGRFLVYQTVPSETAPGQSEIMLRDRRHATVRTVSVAPLGGRANGFSGQPEISGDGRIIVFMSHATNLTEGPDANGARQDIYAADRESGKIARISVDTAGDQPATGASVAPSVSGDGRYVAFVSTATLHPAAAAPEPGAGSRRPLSAVYVRDRSRGITSRVGVAAAGRAPDGASRQPDISADGRFVAFVSDATNMIADDRNRSADVFVADLATGAILLISRSADGGPANGPSGNPAISGDGRFVAFQSEASDIVCARRCTADTEDINLLWDVFLVDRQAAAAGARRLSAGTREGWMEPSVGPALDANATVVVFSSRHPIAASDVSNDFDLFLCAPSAHERRR